MRNGRFQLAVMNGTEPGRADIAAFEKDLRTRAVKVLLYNSQTSQALAERMRTIAGQAGVPVVANHRDAAARETYQAWMLAQLDALDRALGAGVDMYAIELDRVTLARGRRIVLADVSVAIRPGEFIGVFGPNGAGKTTLLHAILGLLRPLAGEIRVFGAKPMRGNRAAGYLPQHRASVADLGLRAWDFVACALDGERWGLPLRESEPAGAKWTPPSQPSRRSRSRPGGCASSRVASCNGCCWRRRCSASRSCFCSMNRS